MRESEMVSASLDTVDTLLDDIFIQFQVENGFDSFAALPKDRVQAALDDFDRLLNDIVTQIQ